MKLKHISKLRPFNGIGNHFIKRETSSYQFGRFDSRIVFNRGYHRSGVCTIRCQNSIDEYALKSHTLVGIQTLIDSGRGRFLGDTDIDVSFGIYYSYFDLLTDLNTQRVLTTITFVVVANVDI